MSQFYITNRNDLLYMFYVNNYFCHYVRFQIQGLGCHLTTCSVVYFTYIFGSIETGLHVRSIELDSIKIHSFSLKLLSFQLLPRT